ncbi:MULTISPECIES: UDP-N-acetylmuramoyl-L-alanyl-D-glutamate--2,6-diaminopimelate ligase [Methylococcus]|uniref:UDP-N-acetylmuramoyl-L-alanyl-D-glutamate--2,6-diaminopimelate ligase n=1 Tax=Methylococcus capsulatus TaxID=414 RepID=A0ABZ2F9S6_METCP|nr:MULTISPECIES: UDP-N-acetylmuramoyl-L-alanyl-D-glutamate--2,6-diaminopimelate ligase [Methylococcus]MDF9391292.1 UDP-N-acetylmuramoyl-L-alanyl-D-glutamate--2,6-diaminopimelate ligase [Methylococcus capsulatus]
MSRANGGTSLRWLLDGLTDRRAVPDIPVYGLSLDSRSARTGDVFFALSGSREHGLRYAEEAVGRGAVVIVYDSSGGGIRMPEPELGFTVPVPDLGRHLGSIAARFFGHPSEALSVIAVTGTNGKTSCTHFIAEALQPDHPTAVIGTLGWGKPEKLRRIAHTTPDAIEIHAILATLRAQGFKLVALEASSHGQAQGRLNGVRCRGALYTRITRDHLDYHGTFESYLSAKLGLLANPALEFVAVTLDDPSVDTILASVPAGVKVIGYSLEGRKSTDFPVIRAETLEQTPEGLRLKVDCSGRTVEVGAPVYGDFNAENLLGTMAILVGLGYPAEAAASRVGRVRPVAGRMERFRQNSLTVIVDYAHTPDALRNVLTSLRRHCRHRLWVVFGCGGDRDKGKRPDMGGIAARLADRVIVTDDNPRGEPGDAIVADILAGCGEAAVTVVRDRRMAIREAIAQAGDGDIVLVAGKGHETFQEVGGVFHEFSDREEVRKALSGRHRNAG